MTEWKPGDAAVGECMGMEIRGFIDSDGRFYTTDQRARGISSSAFALPNLRRLFVIDIPDVVAGVSEARCVVENLRKTAHPDSTNARIANQIEMQIGTPVADEPTEPTARVTDRRDNIWRLLADGDWVCTSGPDIGEYLKWERLTSERGPLEVDS